jgi:YidC/Oxa1 family membrane protein insertase
MDTQRLILFFVFSFSILLLWESWQKESRAPQPVASAPQGVPVPSAPSKSASPATPAPPAAVPAAAPPSAAASAGRGERVRVKTDTLLAEIDTEGGDLVYLELLGHKDTRDNTKNVVLFGPEHRYAAQSGLIGPGLPNHRTPYTVRQKEYSLAPGQDSVEVQLEAPGPAGVKTTKTLRFTRGSYLMQVRHEIENGSAQPIAAHAYFQLTRDGKPPVDNNSMAPTYTGPAVYSEQDKFKKVAFGDIDKDKVPYTKDTDNGWVALIQHYFVSAIIPPEKTPRENYTRKLGEDAYAVGTIEPLAAIQPGAKGSVEAQIYAGPQQQSVLKEIAPGLELVVDYGWLTIIAVPLFWVLQFFHGWTGNWGLAIILLTVTIKLIFFPLSAASYRSMAKMKLVAPRLAKIRELHPDDRMKQNQAMMELYKTEKINPLGGCLPIAVQIPVFIALYWTLLAAVELRHAPFYGWITDLSLQDPWYVLPALMMATMLLQTKMNPTPPDPVQAKVMMIMPFAFGIMFFFFPAGLVLYWLVNNVLSILQQWQINRMFAGAAKTPAKR